MQQRSGVLRRVREQLAGLSPDHRVEPCCHAQGHLQRILLLACEMLTRDHVMLTIVIFDTSVMDPEEGRGPQHIAGEP